MPSRMIHESLCTSEKIAQLTDLEFRVWVTLILMVDDAGRGDARAAIIKGRGFPLRDRVTVKDIDLAVHGLAGKGCISLYVVGGKSYFYFPTWGEHQRIRDVKPKYPAPEESAADCGELRQTAADCGLNKNKNTNTNTNTKDPPIIPPGDAFVDFAGEDQSLLEALREFEASRKKNKKPMTPRAKELLIGELVKEPKEDWITMLNNAILHGWQSVYPLKKEEKQEPVVFKTGPSFDERAAKLREKEAQKRAQT